MPDTIADKKNPVETIVRTSRLLGRMNKSRPADVIYFEMLAAYYERLLNARQNGEFAAAHTIFFPAELLYAMDIVPMHIEETAWMIALFGGHTTDLLAAAAARGYASEICSAHRMLAGGLVMDVVPRPDVVVWTDLVCDSSFKSGCHLKDHFGLPAFFLDHPFQRSAAEEKYLVAELEDLVRFLEERSGRKLNEDRLGEVMARVDRQIQLFREIDDLRKKVPCPLPPNDFLKLMTVDCLFSGWPKAIDYLEALKQELTDNVKSGRGIVSPERFRLASIAMPPLRLMAGVDKTSRQHGAINVADPFMIGWPDGRLDAARPMENVARKLNMLPPMCFWGPLDRRAADKIVDIAVSHRCHGVIFYSQMGCGQTGATNRYLKEALAEVDVPMLTINMDICDTTVCTEEDMRLELERFYEFLGDR